MALKNYLCSKCGSLTKAKSWPSSVGCIKQGLFHSWRDIGEVGNDGFQCETCNTVVYSNKIPTRLGCPGDGFHKWKDVP